MTQVSRLSAYLCLVIVLCHFQFEGLSQTNKKGRNKKFATETFWVNSDCDMCKARIEKACDLKGIKSAEYSKDEFMLTVVYRPDKISLIEIHEAIAKIGYDTSLKKASEEAYRALPDCCQYDRNRK